MILANLFFVFFRISLFAIGGAYSFLPLIEKEVVQRYRWLNREEFLDILAVTKALPGAISIKYATYTGYKIAGIPGLLLANLGNLLAPVLLVVFASIFYKKYKDLPAVKSAFSMVQLVMFAMLISLAFQLISVNQLIQPKNLIIVIVTIIFFIYTKINPVFIILCAGILGVFLR